MRALFRAWLLLGASLPYAGASEQSDAAACASPYGPGAPACANRGAALLQKRAELSQREQGGDARAEMEAEGSAGELGASAARRQPIVLPGPPGHTGSTGRKGSSPSRPPGRKDTSELARAGFLLEVPVGGAVGTAFVRELPLADGFMGSTGNQLWPGSVALGRMILSDPALVSGKSVLELGAGCGLASMVAARFARRTTITDAETDTMENIRYNVAHNGHLWHGGGAAAATAPAPQREIVVYPLLWEDVDRRGWPQERRVDVVIGSDIIYGHWGGLVARVVAQLLLPGGLFLMVSAEDRAGLKHFAEQAVLNGFDVQLSHLHDEGVRYLLYMCRFTAAPPAGGGSFRCSFGGEGLVD